MTTVKAEPQANQPARSVFSPPAALIALAALALFAAAGYLWFTRPVEPVAVESGVRPVGFSLGLDDRDVMRIDRAGARSFWKGTASVFPNGFAAGPAAIWPALGRELPDPSLAPVKIVPTGGFFPFYRSGTFAEEVRAFVRGGGSLICFGQPLGAMYEILPGLAGVGWAEAGCRPKEAAARVQAASDHPVLAALETAEFSAHCGGFFTRFPGTQQTEVILRDAATGQPVIVAYRYGEGLIVATTLLSDAAVLQQKLGAEEKTLLRELLAWARAGGGRLDQHMPGDLVEMAYRLEPGTGTAVDGCARIIRPDGSTEELELPLPAEGGSETRRPYQITEPRGIWRIDSYLRDGNGRPAGPIETGWFVVGRAPAPPEADDLHCTVTLPGTHLVRGSIVPVMVRLWNDGQDASEITYRGPAGKNTVKLAPGQARTIREEIDLDKTGTALVYEFYGPTGERLATVKRRLQVGEPDRVFASISPAGKEAAAGQVVTLPLSIMSVNPGTCQADCWLRLVHDGRILWQEPRRLELSGAYSRTETIKVPLPPGESGRLILEATLAHEGRELARAWTELTVK